MRVVLSSAATQPRASSSTSMPYTWTPLPLLFSPFPQSLFHFTSFEAKTLLLMFSSLQPFFFPSTIFFLAMFTDVLYISSQGILAVTQVKVGHMQELETNCWQMPLSFLIWNKDCLAGWVRWPLPSVNALLLLPCPMHIPEGKLEKHY